MRTYNTVGISTLNTVRKPRFANSTERRFVQLVNNGHEDIYLESVSKRDKNNALRYLLASENFAEDRAEIEDYAMRNSKQLRKELKGEQTCTALVVAGPLHSGVL